MPFGDLRFSWLKNNLKPLHYSIEFQTPLLSMLTQPWCLGQAKQYSKTLFQKTRVPFNTNKEQCWSFIWVSIRYLKFMNSFFYFTEFKKQPTKGHNCTYNLIREYIFKYIFKTPEKSRPETNQKIRTIIGYLQRYYWKELPNTTYGLSGQV